MKLKTPLFELIKTLSKTEAKRLMARLELIATEHSNLQLELFCCIRATRIIDSNAIKSKLKSSALTNYLSFHRRELQNHILSMLSEEIQDEGHVVRCKRTEELSRISTLYNFGFEQAAIRDISELISKIDVEFDASLKLLVLQEEYRMIRSLASDNRKKKLEKVGAEKVAVLRIIRNETDLNILNDQVYSLYQKVRLSKHSDIKRTLNKLFKDELLSSIDKALSFKARVDYYNAYVFRCSILGDCKGMISNQEEVVALWQQNPLQIKRKPFVYFYALVNLLAAYMRKRRFHDFEKVHRIASNIKITNKKKNAAAFIELSSTWLLYLMNTQTVKKAKTFEKKVRAELKLKGKYALTGSGVNLQYNLTSLLFLTGDFEKASKGFWDIINITNDIRDDLKGVARILLVLSEMRKKDSEYIYSLNMAARRYYRKHNELDKMRGIVFKMVDLMINAPDDKTTRIVEQALLDIKKLGKTHPLTIGLEEVEIWMQSQLEGKPIEQVWQKRRKR